MLPISVVGQTAELDALLATATQNWPDLAVRRAELQVADARLAEARRAFRPVVSAGGTYTLAAGGRTIGLPLGDLLNPVYGTLNQLTASENFPSLENQEEALLPNNFYDLRARTQVLILDPEAKRLDDRATLGRTATLQATQVTQADLRLAVRTAYYQALQAKQALRILATADTTVAEALRTTRSLIRNDAALPIARERILAERAEVNAQTAVAKLQLDNALAQLSYYVGTELAVKDVSDEVPKPSFLPDSLGTSVRAEIEQLQTARDLTLLDLEVEEQFRKPRLAFQLDIGSQDFDFGFQPYALAALSLNVPLYDGGRHGLRGQRLRAEAEAAQQRITAARRGIELQQTVAANEVAAARARLAVFEPAISAAERTLRDAQLLYQNGSSGYLELVDARQQLTRLRLQRNLAYYDIQLRQAALLRAYGQ